MYNKENFQQLKLDLYRQFGAPVSSVADLKLFQDAVEYAINEKISYNTLRRFFGFLPQTNPSRKTINSLCQYLGYKNYGAYLKNYASDLEWYAWKKVLNIELNTKITQEDLDWLHTQIHTFQFHMKLSNIIKSKVYRNEIETLPILFDPKLLQFDESNRLKFAAQICLLFRSLNSTTINEIITVLTPIISFRENVLHWFIDYSYLNGYYGKFIKSSLQYAENESHEKLFYELLLGFNTYLSADKNLAEISIDRIKNNFHPVLKGRCFGYNLMFYKDQNNTDKYEEIWNSQMVYLRKKETDIFLFSVEILPALLIVKDIEKITILTKEYYEELLKPTNWSGHHIHAIVLLAYSLQNLCEGRLLEAKKSFELINTFKFNDSYKDYTLIFYKLIEYQIFSLLQREPEQLLKIENDYLFYATKTGFKLFTKSYLRQYLKA